MRKLCMAGGLGVLLVAGCVALTPEQQGRIDEIGVRLGEIQSELKALAPEAGRLAALIAQVKMKVDAKEIPLEEGMKLIEFYRTKRGLILQRIENIKLSAQVIDAEREKLEAEGIGFWRIVGEGAIGVALAFLGINRQVRLRQTRKVAGVMSRVIDRSGENGEAPKAFREELTREAERSGVAAGLLRILHKAAKDESI